MYSYTPPTVIAIDADLLQDCGAFQAVAGALAGQMRRRPVWAVVSMPSETNGDWTDRIASFYRDPRDAPESVSDPHAAIAQALAHHLSEQGITLAVRRAPVPVQPHAPAGAIVVGTWTDAAGVAATLESPFVVAWTTNPRLIPVKVGGIPFHEGDPVAEIGGWDGTATL